MEKSVIQRKAAAVEQLTEKFNNAKTVVVFDYPGLTVSAFTQLRTQLRELGGDVKVYKNNIARRASIAAGFDGLVDTLVGAKAIAISYDDVVAPAKAVYEFSKDNKAVKIVSGVIEGKVASVDQINELATLPSREVMLTMLAAGLLTPVREVAIGLNMLVEEKE
ncbi:50S ribosomal protein L10 [Alteracholeplasma palmae J233]|uniref:Large ribosomal subunit protein uL10 n=1 Tax=Alteracholeplasma palmae (strain ATCC 49389 / J233) TaxID=1318466 RepID=U4KLR4_ALTPJ|nr:50S ribosomal protein L10 [Alteracholeplasma palmae]CCV64853.1 50S ribosomal protein L10 [Alteracholeplasma palmae J233]